MSVVLHPRSWLRCARKGSQSLRKAARELSTIGDVSRAATSSSPPPTSKNRDYLSVAPEVLSKHWDTLPPTKQQLKYANQFFNAQPPTFLWSAPKFARMSFGDSPEICFLGRSNVGKSSLLNSILGRRAIAHVSSKPGRTQSMNAFSVGAEEDNGKNRLVVLDMPGYGKGGRAMWGKEILKYLSQRKQLRRAFLLVDSEHGVKTTDQQLLALFRKEGIPHQVLLSKVDKVLFPTNREPSEAAFQSRLADLRRRMDTVQNIVQPDLEDEEGLVALGEMIAFSSEKTVDGRKLGIDAVRHAMLQAAGLGYRPEIIKKSSQPEIVPHDVWQAM